MRQRVHGLALVALLGVGLTARAQEIEFIEPAARTVRGTVPVKVDLGPGFRNGYVVFYLGEPGAAMRFHQATVADNEGLFGFLWDTQSQDSQVADGEYRILAIGYNATGDVIGQRALTVDVQNAVTLSSLPARGIPLRYNLTPGRETKFLARTDVRVAAGQGAQGEGVDMFNSAVTAWWNSRVLWTEKDGSAQVRHSIYALAEQGARGGHRPMLGNNNFVTLAMRPDGQYNRVARQAHIVFPYGELGLELPQQPVKIGDSWRGALRFLVDARTLRADTVVANNTLTRVEWHAGYRTAIIESEFEAGPYKLELLGEDRDNEEWYASVTITIKGKRRTYFAYQPEVGKVLRIEEDQQQLCTLELEEEPVATGTEGGEMGYAEGSPILPGGGLPGGGAPGSVGAEAGLTEVQSKPAGFSKGGAAFRKKNPTPAGGGGELAPELAAEPVKVDVIQFTRNVRTDLKQDFLRTTR